MRSSRKRACALGWGGLEILREVFDVRELEFDPFIGLIITRDALSSAVAGPAREAIQSATG